jgi:hypothetical protein
MHSGSFSNLTLGKAGQQAESLGARHNASVFLHPALELDLVVKRTLF